MLVITVYCLAMLFLKYDNWAEDFPSDHPFYLQHDNARMKGAHHNMGPSMVDSGSLILSVPYVLRCHTGDFARVTWGNGLRIICP